MSRSPSPSRRKLTSTPRPDDTLVNHNKPFLVRHKDDKLLENRNFGSFARPKPRRTRSKSPTRRPRSTSPSRLGSSSVQPLPGIHCYSVNKITTFIVLKLNYIAINDFTSLSETTSIPVCFIWESPSWALFQLNLYGRCGDLMVGRLDSRSIKCSHLNPGWGMLYCILARALYSHRASFHPVV